ncbi:MAG: alpha/beta hydrolase family esterase [Rubrimonas sp.]
MHDFEIAFDRRRFLVTAFAALAWPGMAHARDGTERTITLPQGPRHWREFVPPGGAAGRPVIILLHGGGQSMHSVLDSRAGGSRRWLQIARREDCVLLVPNGTDIRSGSPTGNRQSWSDFPRPNSANADDVGFLAALVDYARRDLGADDRRIYLTGASNGGMMTFRMLIERPDLFAAAASFIANLPEGRLPDPPQPTPLLMMNGTNDPFVPWDGGALRMNRGRVRSTEATVQFWQRANGATGNGRSVTVPDRDPADGCRMFLTRWKGQAPVVLVRAEGGGHQIPDTETPRRPRLVERALGPACRDADGAEIAWQFFSEHRR